MKRPDLLLLASRQTPAPRWGLALADGPHDPAGAWIHGALVLDAAQAGDAARWLRALTLCAISERHQLALAASPVADERSLAAVAWEPLVLDGAPMRRLAFSAHSSWLFPYGLHADRYHAHAAADVLRSEVATLRPAEAAAPAWGDGPGDALV
ncbi:MAG: hypothetical protein JWM10_5161, partial [Myxococcaceae bacterium]|nr:hypothetical protein [Myxococcaceae bacterium]